MMTFLKPNFAKGIEPMNDKLIYTEKEAAQYIGMSKYFLQRDRSCGVTSGRTPGPAFIKMGRSVRYLKDDLDQWINQHRIDRSQIES